jgi:hypothetical protein
VFGATMNQPSNSELVVRPLVCFGLVLLAGALGFGHAKLTNNGFFLIGFLIAYVPCSLVACVVGGVFAAKAYRVLPANHKGRRILTTVISLAVLGVAACLLLALSISSSLSRP